MTNPRNDALEAHAIIRGLLQYADGHELRGRYREELDQLKKQAYAFLRIEPSPAAPDVAGLIEMEIQAANEAWLIAAECGSSYEERMRAALEAADAVVADQLKRCTCCGFMRSRRVWKFLP